MRLFRKLTTTTTVFALFSHSTTMNTPRIYNNANSSQSLSIFFKIFINYMQMISIIQGLELKWPYYVSNYLKIIGSLGYISGNFFSVDCLINDYDINLKAIYLQAFLIFFIYVVFFSIAAGFFMIRRIFFKKKQEFNTFIILMIVLSIMIQPISLKQTSDLFNCQDIENTRYLVQQISIPCYTDEHNQWVYYL